MARKFIVYVALMTKDDIMLRPTHYGYELSERGDVGSAKELRTFQ